MARFFTFALLSAFLAHPSLVHPQSASLTGVIVDPTGAVVPGTTIRVLSASGELERQVVSGWNGQFSMSGLEPGKWTVTAKHPGMFEFRKEGLKLKPGKVTRLEITVGVSPFPAHSKRIEIKKPFAMLVERKAKTNFERGLISKAEHAPCPEDRWCKQDADEPLWPVCLNWKAIRYYENLIHEYELGIFPRSVSKLHTGQAYYYAAIKRNRSKKGWVVEMYFQYAHSCGNLCGLGFEIIRTVYFDQELNIVKTEGDGQGWIS